MFVFVCAGCAAELAAPLSQVALPAHAHQKYGNGIQLPALMEPGTFAVEPEPWGAPWRRWEGTDPDEVAARGVQAPVHALSDGAPGAIVIASGDTRGAVLIPEKRGGACCGLDGSVATIGCCIGGALVMRTATAHPDQVAAVAGFHPGFLVTDAPDSPHRLIPELTAEVHLGLSENDMPSEAITELNRALDAAGVRHATEIYPGTVHGFTLTRHP
ncbi:dienelactone hydrolase family protein [Streptomyces sp. NPDC047515]|uniref:dienelactone hydrolase family protein n=1 Tax=Streptomyces sp. NPDC047515 TaxID=3155380 RepID=UPI0033D4D5FA